MGDYFDRFPEDEEQEDEEDALNLPLLIEAGATAAEAERREQSQSPIEVLPLVPLLDTVIFPNMVVPVSVGRPISLKAIDVANGTRRRLGDDDEGPAPTIVMVAQRDRAGEATPENLYDVGTVATINQIVRMPDGTSQAIVQGISRARILNIEQAEPYIMARVERINDTVERSLEVEALMRSVSNLIEQYIKLSKAVPEEAMTAIRNITEPGWLADVIGYSPDLSFADRQRMLATFDPAERLRIVGSILNQQIEILSLKTKIQTEVQKGFEKTQRDYYLREQLRAIQRELGEGSPEDTIGEELKAKIEASAMPQAVKEVATRETDRLMMLPQASPETAVVRNYVDWLLALPWKSETEDRLDLKEAAAVLDADHYGLKKVKERILEYMAVRKLSLDAATREREERGETEEEARERRSEQGSTLRSPILCFVGPPGVGKTSLGRSIAKAMGRKFVRLSLGGVRDEAEIRGHRRTYIGALPGRVIQSMRDAATNNPVFMLDEIDKVGMDFRGDPTSALLEVLDPEQNFSFSDHYLEVPYDLSQVIFIATANMLDPIPPALRDRMEIIELPGYTEEEKLQIAKQYLVPKQREAHGLSEKDIRFTDKALLGIIREYTHEAGVRNLERQIASICRKVARKVAEREDAGKGRRSRALVIDRNDLGEYLGPEQFLYGMAQEEDEVGVATGVVWTQVGGDLLSIEVNVLEGQGDFMLTGQLGDVMKESARAALSYARSKAGEWNIEPAFFADHTFHIHVPAGGVPKEGPSAGITMATALISALTGRAVRRDVAMTGEITLRGRVLPIGGLKEKMLAAHRAGIKTFILPKKNERDLVEIPKAVLSGLRIVPVEHMDEVLAVALVDDTSTERAA